MFTSVQHFIDAWTYEAASTQKLLDTLTDASLAQPVHPGGRTLGRVAWHIVQTIPEMMGRTGLKLAGPGEHDPPPTSAAAIAAAYATADRSLREQIAAHWTDATLAEQDDMYGDLWSRGMTLAIIIRHEAHHRGQMTVLMRQAGLPVAGVYGPSAEEWAAYGAPAPE